MVPNMEARALTMLILFYYPLCSFPTFLELYYGLGELVPPDWINKNFKSARTIL